MSLEDLYRAIPKVDVLIEDEEWIKSFSNIPRPLVLKGIRNALDIIRDDIKEKKDIDYIKNKIRDIKDIAENEIYKAQEYNLKRVINATGVVLHTNMGRALIAEDVISHISSILMNYSNLEYDLVEGVRGSRYSHAVDIICEITGAEDAMVVNNNAAAVILVLNTLANDREVITSRGELVEIGGSFRIPDVMNWSGARLIDVGTTNKTHLSDYKKAITEYTAAILKVHTSNYRIMGFTQSVTAEELLSLNLPVFEDLGSGVLIDLSKYGIEKEPTVQDAVRSGVDILTFSGDKLLGGPQAGIICGKKKYIDQIKKNPLTRALRVDKFTLSALEATFRFYLDEEVAVKKIPTLRMITKDKETIKDRAKRLKSMIGKTERLIINVLECESQVGGGSLPTTLIPSYGLSISVKDKKIELLESALRSLPLPIVGRIHEERLIFDLRTVRDEELELLSEGLLRAVNSI